MATLPPHQVKEARSSIQPSAYSTGLLPLAEVPRAAFPVAAPRMVRFGPAEVNEIVVSRMKVGACKRRSDSVYRAREARGCYN